MNFFKALFGDEPSTAIKAPEPPDFGNYWKEYSGWMANINKRTEGELADVRARLSAAGASPDLLMMQNEHLESQRKSDIAKLSGGPTYDFLTEGYEIATGKRANPYGIDLPGMSREMVPESETWDEVDGARTNRQVTPAHEKQIFDASASVEEYYSKYFGKGEATPPSAGEAAAKRAKIGASGGAPAGSGGNFAVSPALRTDDSFWG